MRAHPHTYTNHHLLTNSYPEYPCCQALLLQLSWSDSIYFHDDLPSNNEHTLMEKTNSNSIQDQQYIKNIKHTFLYSDITIKACIKDSICIAYYWFAIVRGKWYRRRICLPPNTYISTSLELKHLLADSITKQLALSQKRR